VIRHADSLQTGVGPDQSASRGVCVCVCVCERVRVCNSVYLVRVCECVCVRCGI